MHDLGIFPCVCHGQVILWPGHGNFGAFANPSLRYHLVSLFFKLGEVGVVYGFAVSYYFASWVVRLWPLAFVENFGRLALQFDANHLHCGLFFLWLPDKVVGIWAVTRVTAFRPCYSRIVFRGAGIVPGQGFATEDDDLGLPWC